MVSALGAHSPRLDSVRDLLTSRGRREQGRFAFEGPTLLAEALRSGLPVEAIYASEAASRSSKPACGKRSIARFTWLHPSRSAGFPTSRRPPGIVAVAPARLLPIEEFLKGAKAVFLLAGVADPGNAGTLVRSAEIFGVDSVLFAEGGVEPYNPKVVRAAMGAIFRERLAVVEPGSVVDLAHRHAFRVVAAERRGVPLHELSLFRALHVGSRKRAARDGRNSHVGRCGRNPSERARGKPECSRCGQHRSI